MPWSFYNANGVLLKTGLGTSNIQSTTLATSTQTTVTTANTYYDVTGLTVNITPTTVNSKVLIIGQIGLTTASDTLVAARLVRGSTAIGQPTGASNRIIGNVGAYYATAVMNNSGTHYPLPFQYLDSPASTATLTYKVQVTSNVNGTVVSVNRSSADADNTSYFRATSTITAIEQIQ